jgi:hypothetical protein
MYQKNKVLSEYCIIMNFIHKSKHKSKQKLLTIKLYKILYLTDNDTITVITFSV